MSGFLVELLGEKLVAGGGEEVDVHSLGARGISLLGLYFGCSLSAPCAQLSASLAAFYGRLRGDAPGTGPESRGAGAAAAVAAAAAAAAAAAPAGAAAEPESEPEPRRRLEIVFVSSDQDQQQWQEFVRDMPWLALPYKEKHRKLKLWNKYRISNIPSLIFIDATTGKVVCRNGLLVIRDDPEGLEFPWGPKPFSEVIAGPLLRNNGQSLDSSCLEGSHVGVYFSAHWCPPCRSLTRVLVESYRKIKESGQKFEIIFVSADRSEDSFKQYFSEMPWLAVPYTDEARRSRLNRLYGIQGIPTLIVLDPKGELITRQGRVEVLNDEDCREFPWHPKPVLELSDSNAVQLNEGPCLVLFVDSEDDGESDAAKQLIQPIAEKIIAKYKAKEEEAPLLFFVAGEDDMTDSLRDYTNLPEAAPLLTILDMSARAKYVMDVEEITPVIVEAFVNDFLAEKLKPEPI
ncbi:nucleoredoxin [Monodelphis domestica]|uniref:nucleoredoxin n=1 Tax=Monodelphis domestica TaxID=13616 RepID=UPI0024E1B6EA|nr:nucleoredoxin [Monodelphis domestica]